MRNGEVYFSCRQNSKLNDYFTGDGKRERRFDRWAYGESKDDEEGRMIFELGPPLLRSLLFFSLVF